MTGPYTFVIILFAVFLGTILLSNIAALVMLTSLRLSRSRARKKAMAERELA